MANRMKGLIGLNLSCKGWFSRPQVSATLAYSGTRNIGNGCCNGLFQSLLLRKLQ